MPALDLLDLVDDPVVQQLPARSFRLLVNLVGLAQDGPLPARDRLAWRLHLTEAALARDVAPLVAAGRVFEDGDVITLAGGAPRGRPESAPKAPPAPASQPAAEGPRIDATSPTTPTDTPAGAAAVGSRERTRAWRERKRAEKEGQGRLALFSTVTGGDAVTRHTVTGDAGDASHPVTASPHQHFQRLTSVTPTVTGVTPLHRESLSYKTLENQTQTLAREGDAVTGCDASPPRTDIAAARAAYDRFRPLYPKPASMDPRQPAEQEFLRLVLREGVDPERVIAALGPFAAQLKRDRIEARFVPSSVRWLRERRFDDLAPIVGQPPSGEAVRCAAAKPPDPWLVPVLRQLSAHIGADLTNAWFSQLSVRHQPGGVMLAAPSDFVAATIEARHAEQLRRAVAAVHGETRVMITGPCTVAPAPRQARAPP
ncbi:hypothetical protein [Rhodoplanes roseus]|uniref:DnaA N-terminal domain-containing protein n=1 Tax=Rhodoplanes roseus TaxID=29409 RepID=A0A327KWW3_9BRAD|nr:hypothetical protein [Rhodoplanes roseus]RAI42647.1 hypothetical protein CH341_18480 [Rhodoplanes roseus]